VRAGVEERRLLLRLDAAGRSDTGRVRRINQDRFGIAGDLGIAVVCDGMGGPAGGEIASSVALETFLTVVRQEIEGCRGARHGLTARALGRAAAAANRAVRARAEFDTRFRGMGTTLVAARLEGHELSVLNVGDSRAYVVRGGVARQVTLDHSFVGERLRMGAMTQAEADESPLQSVITRAIGIEEDVRPDIFEEKVQRGDVVLLCSDGLIRHVGDEEIGGLLSGRGAAVSVERMGEDLIALANARGGSDNITCVLMRVVGEGAEES
jgi:PPM family protein phosphatase